eukprot:1781358-Pyramimonas_sp.AAC.2
MNKLPHRRSKGDKPFAFAESCPNGVIVTMLRLQLPFFTPETNQGVFYVEKEAMLEWLDKYDSPDQIAIKSMPPGFV